MTAAPQHPSHLRQLPRPLIWLSLLSFSLGACAPNLGPQPNLGWIEASSPKRLEVDRAEYRHSIYFPTDSSALPAAERARLLTFLETVRPSGRDSIRLEGHADERASEQYNIELATRRAERVAAFLKEAGLGDLLLPAAEPDIEPPFPAAVVRVGVRHHESVWLHGLVDLGNVAERDQSGGADPRRFPAPQLIGALIGD